MRDRRPARSRHTPKTLERAARVRQLRDLEALEWKQIAGALGIAPSTAVYLYRCDPQAVLEDDLERVERVLYLTAAMTGLRQGELLALRWLDIDWIAQRIRVRRNFVRGRFGTPKSKRSCRSVPLADEVAGELELLFRASAYRPTRTSSSRTRIPAAPGPLAGAQAVQTGAEARRRARDPLSRSAAYVRDEDGGRRASRCAPFRSGWATATTRRR